MISLASNEKTRKKFDDAIASVIDFQKKHNITDAKW